MRHWIIPWVFLVATGLGAAEYNPPPQHKAEYTIDKGPFTVARATTRFYPAGDSAYLYRLHARTTGIARLFAGMRVRERSRGLITDQGYRPKRYTQHQTGGDKAQSTEIEFDWQQGRVRNKAGEPAWDLKIPKGTLDRLVSPLQLMYDLSVGGESERRMTYHIADDGELKSYTVRIGERREVVTPAGRFEAVQVVRRSSNGKRETRLWCAPALAYLPVKITQREDDEDDLTLLLESVDGLSREASSRFAAE